MYLDSMNGSWFALCFILFGFSKCEMLVCHIVISQEVEKCFLFLLHSEKHPKQNNPNDDELIPPLLAFH